MEINSEIANIYENTFFYHPFAKSERISGLIVIIKLLVLIPVFALASTHEPKFSPRDKLSFYEDHIIPVSVEEIAAIVAKKMGIEKYPIPVVKNMTQKEFDFSFLNDTHCQNQIKATYAYFFLEENVINWGPQFPLDRLAHEIVHYFQKYLGYNMHSEDIYYEMEEQAASIQIWFRENYSHGF